MELKLVTHVIETFPGNFSIDQRAELKLWPSKKSVWESLAQWLTIEDSNECIVDIAAFAAFLFSWTGKAVSGRGSWFCSSWQKNIHSPECGLMYTRNNWQDERAENLAVNQSRISWRLPNCWQPYCGVYSMCVAKRYDFVHYDGKLEREEKYIIMYLTTFPLVSSCTCRRLRSKIRSSPNFQISKAILPPIQIGFSSTKTGTNAIDQNLKWANKSNETRRHTTFIIELSFLKFCFIIIW